MWRKSPKSTWPKCCWAEGCRPTAGRLDTKGGTAIAPTWAWTTPHPPLPFSICCCSMPSCWRPTWASRRHTRPADPRRRPGAACALAGPPAGARQPGGACGRHLLGRISERGCGCVGGARADSQHAPGPEPGRGRPRARAQRPHVDRGARRRRPAQRTAEGAGTASTSPDRMRRRWPRPVRTRCISPSATSPPAGSPPRRCSSVPASIWRWPPTRSTATWSS